MISDFTFDSALTKIGILRGWWVDKLVPCNIPPHPSSLYAPEYAWMFTYERELKKRLEAVLGRSLDAYQRYLFGPGGAFSEGLSNAFLHGHQRQPHIPITVECAVGLAGLVLVITDSGSGFAVEETIAELRRGGGYYRIAGSGLRSLAQSPLVHASFSKKGKQLILVLLF